MFGEVVVYWSTVSMKELCRPVEHLWEPRCDATPIPMPKLEFDLPCPPMLPGPALYAGARGHDRP